MYDHLPKNRKTFSIDVTGNDTYVKYTGEFTVKCILDMTDKHSLELEKTRMMADYANPSRNLAGIALFLATVRTKIIDAPKWWEELSGASKLIDENVLIHLYDKCTEAEEEWRKKVKELAGVAEEEEKAEAEAKKEEEEGN
jgi:hypothetical protein